MKAIENFKIKNYIDDKAEKCLKIILKTFFRQLAPFAKKTAPLVIQCVLSKVSADTSHHPFRETKSHRGS